MVDPQALAEELNGLLGIETRSMLRHLDESTPYTTVKTLPILKQFQSMEAASHRHAERLTALLSKLELPERTRPFPQVVGFFHFVTLEALLAPITDEQRQRVEAYERAIDFAQGDAAVVSELQALLDENRASLTALEQLQQGDAVAAGAG